ncbi:MAG TPA: DUF433 domain-containing protein [Candidatus Lokiarchaeia archaeon]|nr:DUF433 domain-containing protein [Candidatus Lokiarchaeia archaeon]
MEAIIETDPEILGGTPVIRGTRIPVSLIFELVGLRYTIEQILEFYPDLTRDIVIKVLSIGKELQASLEGVDLEQFLGKEIVLD